MTEFNEKKIFEFIETSGFPFEMKAAECFERLNWDVYPGFDFIDVEEGKNRELDFVATKKINGINFHILVECKHSNSSVWIFAQKKKRIFNEYYHATKHFPTTFKGVKERRRIPLQDLPVNNPKAVEANNYLVCKKNGDAFKDGRQTIKEGVNQLIKAFINYSHNINANNQTYARNVYLLFLITNCPIYATGQKSTVSPSLEKYLVYGFKFNFEPSDWEEFTKDEDSDNNPYAKYLSGQSASALALSSQKYKSAFSISREGKRNFRKSLIEYAVQSSEKYQIEVINADFIHRHLMQIEAIVNKFPKEIETYWPLKE